MYISEQEMGERNATYAPGATITALAGEYGSMRMMGADGDWHTVPNLPERYTYHAVNGERVAPVRGYREKAQALIAEAKRRAVAGESIEGIDTESL